MENYELLEKKYCSGEPFVSAALVANHLGLNIWTVYKLAERGKIPSHKFGKSLRFKLSDLERHKGIGTY